MMLYLTLLILCKVVSAQNITTDNVVRNFLFDNRWANEYVISEHQARSVSECAVKCRLTDTCASFFYRHVSPQCQLNPFIRYVVDFVPEFQASRYYALNSATNFTLPPTPAHPADYHTFLLSDGSVVSFRVIQIEMDFYSAQANCESEGATLARITTIAKMQLFQHILRSWGSVPALRDHWVSGIRPIVANTSDWITDFGEPIPSTRDFWQGGSLDYVYDNWLIEYPTYPMETEPCVVFYFPDFFLNNVPCVISLTYSICEKP